MPRRKVDGQPPRAGAPGARRAFARTLVLALVVLAIGYFHTWNYGFHFDEFSNIRDNPVLQPPLDLRALWHFWPSRVLAFLTWAIQAGTTGLTPPALHAVNLGLHLTCALLVGWLASGFARRFLRTPAGAGPGRVPRHEILGMLATLLFVAHPLATQAVTYLAGRTVLLTCALELGAVAMWLRAREGGRPVALVAAWVLGLGAAFTREMAIALPIQIAALEILLRRRGAAPSPRVRTTILRALPFGLVWVAVASAAVLPSAKRPAGLPGFAEAADLPRLHYLLTQLTVVPRYLALVVWPHGQSLDPDVTIRHGVDAAVVAGAAVLALLTLLAFRFGSRRPLLLAGWLWFAIGLMPESSIFPIRDVMTEHRMYVPLVGLAWAAAVLLEPLASGGAVRALIPAAVVLTLGVVTHVRNRVWRDEATLWADVIAKAPQRSRGFNNYALALEQQGRLPEAEAAYRQALSLEPDYVYGLANLGRLCAQQGRLREGIQLLERADRLAPGTVEVLNNLGLCWIGLGDTARAVASWKAGLAHAPNALEPAENLARVGALESGEAGRARLP